MIDPSRARIGDWVFYQRPDMEIPQDGAIVGVGEPEPLVFVLFYDDLHAKACNPADLFWPPDFREPRGLPSCGLQAAGGIDLTPQPGLRR